MISVYEMCKYYQDENICKHPDGQEGDNAGVCIDSDCDSWELVCPLCKKKIMDADDRLR